MLGMIDGARYPAAGSESRQGTNQRATVGGGAAGLGYGDLADAMRRGASNDATWGQQPLGLMVGTVAECGGCNPGAFIRPPKKLGAHLSLGIHPFV
jgi:hypothetical protein